MKKLYEDSKTDKIDTLLKQINELTAATEKLKRELGADVGEQPAPAAPKAPAKDEKPDDQKTPEELKAKYLSSRKYTKEEMIADIRHQLSTNPEKALKGFKAVWKGFEDKIPGKGFNRNEFASFVKKRLIYKIGNAINDNREVHLNNDEKKLLCSIMPKYAAQVWDSSKSMYIKIGSRYAVRKTLQEQIDEFSGYVAESLFDNQRDYFERQENKQKAAASSKKEIDEKIKEINDYISAMNEYYKSFPMPKDVSEKLKRAVKERQRLISELKKR